MLRSSQAVLTMKDVKKMLDKYKFSSKSIEWNKEFCNEQGIFVNDFHDNSDGTVIDKATGLMWQQDSAPLYTRWEDAKKYIERINYEQFAGYSDWRLPTIEELASLIKKEKNDKDLYIDPIFTDKMWFWSIDTVDKKENESVSEELIWTANFHYGAVYWLDKKQGQDVKAVRSLSTDCKKVLTGTHLSLKLRSEPTDCTESDVKEMLSKYSFYSKNIGWNATYCNDNGTFHSDLHDNCDGTVSDRATGLMWQHGCSPNYCRWYDVETYINQLNKVKFAGYDDWRTPTVEEFASLIKNSKGKNDLYIDEIFSKRMWFWTSDTKGGSDSDFVWTANAHYGTVFWLEKNQGHDIKAVRSMRIE
jgi:hypothetical protein